MHEGSYFVMQRWDYYSLFNIEHFQKAGETEDENRMR